MVHQKLSAFNIVPSLRCSKIPVVHPAARKALIYQQSHEWRRPAQKTKDVQLMGGLSDSDELIAGRLDYVLNIIVSRFCDGLALLSLVLARSWL